MSYQNNQYQNAVAIEQNLLNVEYIPSDSFRADSSKGIEVHKAILSIQKAILEIGGIPKLDSNDKQHYKFRSIELLQAVITPLMVKYDLTCIASVERSSLVQFLNNKKETQFKAMVQVRYIFTSTIDSSVLEVVMMGEANDSGDKGILKATTCAQKNLYNQIFAIPTSDQESALSRNKNDNQSSSYNSNYKKKSSYNNQSSYNDQPNYNNNQRNTAEQPRWQVNDPQARRLASPALKQAITDRLTTHGKDIYQILSKLGLKMDTVTDAQLRTVFEETKLIINADKTVSIQ